MAASRADRAELGRDPVLKGMPCANAKESCQELGCSGYDGNGQNLQRTRLVCLWAPRPGSPTVTSSLPVAPTYRSNPQGPRHHEGSQDAEVQRMGATCPGPHGGSGE